MVHTSDFSKRKGKQLDNRLKHVTGKINIIQIFIMKQKNYIKIITIVD